MINIFLLRLNSFNGLESVGRKNPKRIQTLVVGGALVFFGWLFQSDPTEAPTVPASSPAVQTGNTAPMSKDAFLAVDEKVYDELQQAIVADDKHGINLMIIAGQVSMINAGDKILALNRGLFKTKVRMTSGGVDGRQVGYRRSL
jgi:hypothetical protein